MDKFIDSLIDNGIKYAFGVTGSGESLTLIAGLQRAGVEYFPVSHEATASFAAGACCRDGKSRAVAITIKGPGFINLTPGVVSNYYESRPAMTISEAYDKKVPLYRTHKRLDHKTICKPIYKEYGTSNQNNIVNKLLHKAQCDPAGPVHIDFTVNGDFDFNDDDKLETKDIAVDEKDLNKLEKFLEESSYPCLILGSLAARSDIDWNSVRVPVVTTSAAKGCYDETLKWSAGIITGEVSDLSSESRILNKADLIIGIGLRNTELVKIEQYSAPLVMIDTINEGLQDGFDSKLSIINKNINDTVKLLLIRLSNKTWGVNKITRQKLDIDNALLSNNWLTAKAFNTFQKCMSDNTVLVLDTGFFCTVGETVWKSRRANLFCGSSVGRFMGSAIPTSIGVSISSKYSPVLCVMGDGGISPYFGEISIAVKEKLPIVFVLMTDGCYGECKKYALHDINHTFKKSTLTAIVGPSGSGKTTFIDIISGYRRPVSGSILVNGVNVNQYNYNTLIELVSYVPQNPQIFDGITIYEHISYGIPNTSLNEVINASKLSGAYEFIKKLPKGFDTILLGDSSGLSGGQKQRIDLSRALLKDTPILIMDEPTGNLDIISENKFMSNISNIRSTTDKIIIIIAHRIYTVADANQIIVMDDGKIKNIGSHSELLLSSNWYKLAASKI